MDSNRVEHVFFLQVLGPRLPSDPNIRPFERFFDGTYDSK